MGEHEISTRIEPKEERSLGAFWERSSLWPVVMEEATGIMSRDGEPVGFYHFCPEVIFMVYGLFACDLHRYSDEIDLEMAHKRLANIGAKRDWRWHWNMVVPQHYTGCPLYSKLLSTNTSGRSDEGNEILEFKPGLWGININLKALWGWFKKRLALRRK